MMSILRKVSCHKLGIRIGACLALSGLSVAASATSNVTSPVIGLYPYTAAAAKATLIFVATAIPNGTEGCPTHTPANVVYLDMTDAQASTIYATLLAGFLTGEAMSIGVNGCSSSGIPLIYQVTLGSQT